MLPYENHGPMNCDVDIDTTSVKGKTAIVTGGANGIGAGYVDALTRAGAFVVVADLDADVGAQMERDSNGSVKFVKCNVTTWADQLAAFKTALSSSPSGRLDIVIANAGISGGDSVFFNDVDAEEPQEPRLNILNVNSIGALYTIKLALHYFRRQDTLNQGPPREQVLILQGSLAGYLHLPGAIQYSHSKYGLRGIFTGLRISETRYNIRVGYIAPWFIKTAILSDAILQHLNKSGLGFATVEDATAAVMRFVTDPATHGRSFAIVPRNLAPRGYWDLEDDYTDSSFLGRLQNTGAVGANHRQAMSEEDQKTRTQWNDTQ